MTELFREQTRTAAKFYRCDECHERIAPGQRYNRWFQVFEGWACGGHTCLTCAGMRTEGWLAFDWDPEIAPMLGELRASLRADWGVADPDAWYAERVARREAERAQAALIAGAAAALQGGGA